MHNFLIAEAQGNSSKYDALDKDDFSYDKLDN